MDIETLEAEFKRRQTEFDLVISNAMDNWLKEEQWYVDKINEQVNKRVETIFELEMPIESKVEEKKDPYYIPPYSNDNQRVISKEFLKKQKLTINEDKDRGNKEDTLNSSGF